ncbi:uncharacterized protein LOC143613017 [Bidens hawaiensis]|uniref:uncharacterized protein LOC143613017 n=1 Tax=Bidens hawaiensis TaxID=980011 RepID=UPI00404968B1
MALRRRNIEVDDCSCVFCGVYEETVDHLFSACTISIGVWQGIAAWCRIPFPYLFSVKDVLDIHSQMVVPKEKRKVLYGIAILTCWRLWKARNELIFSSKRRGVVEIVSDVKSLGYLCIGVELKRIR